MSTIFYTYIVEYSNLLRDGAYIRFDRRLAGTDDTVVYGPTIYADQWQQSQLQSCIELYNGDDNRCSYLAPFDAPMHINLQLVSGTEYCLDSDNGIGDSDNVDFEISKVVVSTLHFDNCDGK
jgi:hypothetical protein